MSVLTPLYIAAETKVAWQLSWSLSVFANNPLPPPNIWLEPLMAAAQKDDVRILEHRVIDITTHQFMLSTAPAVLPAQIIRSIKGRLQHEIRAEIPKAFRRNYRIVSVGEVNLDRTQGYIGRQPEKHPMADPRVQDLIQGFQFIDPDVDLASVRYTAHGQFIHNLHIVFENLDRLNDVHRQSLQQTRDAVIRSAAKHGWLLERIGLLSNHLHILLGCCISDSPLEVGLSLMNNIAYCHQMKAVLDYSFYAGTVGPYDRDAIRRSLRESA